MNQNLEGKIGIRGQQRFKSGGEKRIAYFLEGNSIKYQYEPGVLVNSASERPRIWYPDFYLPEFGIYIEYFGLAGRKSYDDGIRRKQEKYSAMGMNVISVYPWNFCEEWQEYIMKELERITVRRYRKLMAKPYWSQRKFHEYSRANTLGHRYHQMSTKRY